jgi:glycosyltransferase involved in cell wall biosynthesis
MDKKNLHNYYSIRHHKVLIINDSLGPNGLIGGKERQLALLAKYLPNEWERKIWVMNFGPDEKTLREDNNFNYYYRPRKWRFDLSPAFDLWRLIFYWHPDIIHAWGWMSCLAAIPLCRILGIPLINGTIRGGNKPLRKTMLMGQWVGLKMADGIIANSRAGLSAWKITNQKSKVLYNGFEPERQKYLNHLKKDDKFTIVMVGRMAKEKDFRSFIDAAKLVSEKGGSWRFIAIGFGPERSELIDYAKDLIEMKVLEFPVPEREVIPLMRSADVGVLMTTHLTYEGCSNAVMEYMALRLPVICSLGGGNQEIVIEGQNGFLIPPGKSEALVDRLWDFYNNRDLARRMGNAGYELFLQLFSVEKMVEGIVRYYEQFVH